MRAAGVSHGPSGTQHVAFVVVGASPAPRPCVGDVVNFVRANVWYRGTLAGFANDDERLCPRGLATVFVLGCADPFFVEPEQLAVVRRFDPTDFGAVVAGARE